MTDVRDHYTCDGDCGGCGVCVPHGARPDPPVHVPQPGQTCGTYQYDGPCEACATDPEMERFDDAIERG